MGSLHLVVDDGIGFDLDQPFGIDEAGNLHDGIDGANVAEEFAMHGGDGLPIFDPCEEDARADDVSHGSTCLLERSSDNFKAATGLSGGVTGRDGAAIRTERGGTGDGNDRTDTDGARNSHFRFVRTSTGD